MNGDLLHLTHTGEEPNSYRNAVTPPVFLTSLHVYDSFEEFRTAGDENSGRYVYGRCSNPTTDILEKKLAALENGAAAAVFASGMAAATSAIMATCQTGSHIICIRDCYGPVKSFINGMCVPRLGMSVTYVSGLDTAEIETAIKPETSLIILESPATFVFSVCDLEAIAKIAKKHGIKTYIDNTYCTPLGQKPLDFGIDISMHTLSKYIGGHSDIIGGALISSDAALMNEIKKQPRELFGGIIGPMEAWLAIRGLRTLDVRLERHERTATAIATYLEKHPKVKRVYYTGLESHPQHELVKKQQLKSSGLMGFELDTTTEKSVEFIDNLHLFGKGCSWGGHESLAILPMYGADKETLDFLRLENNRLIRIHCGLEGADNLLADLEKALATV